MRIVNALMVTIVSAAAIAAIVSVLLVLRARGRASKRETQLNKLGSVSQRWLGVHRTEHQ